VRGIATVGNKPIRAAPAYQEYAADMLSTRAYRLMTLAERGLFDTMRRECWVNGSVPRHPEELAKIVNAPPPEVTTCLTERVLSFFECVESSLTCPELDKYRQSLDLRRNRQSEGGRNGGLRSSAQRKAASSGTSLSEASLEANLQGKVKPLRTEQLNGAETKKVESSKEWLSPEEEEAYINAFTDSNGSNEYARQSRGY
jgi:hypothetical protein